MSHSRDAEDERLQFVSLPPNSIVQVKDSISPDMRVRMHPPVRPQRSIYDCLDGPSDVHVRHNRSATVDSESNTLYRPPSHALGRAKVLLRASGLASEELPTHGRSQTTYQTDVVSELLRSSRRIGPVGGEAADRSIVQQSSSRSQPQPEPQALAAPRTRTPPRSQPVSQTHTLRQTQSPAKSQSKPQSNPRIPCSQLGAVFRKPAGPPSEPPAVDAERSPAGQPRPPTPPKPSQNSKSSAPKTQQNADAMRQLSAPFPLFESVNRVMRPARTVAVTRRNPVPCLQPPCDMMDGKYLTVEQKREPLLRPWESINASGSAFERTGTSGGGGEDSGSAPSRSTSGKRRSKRRMSRRMSSNVSDRKSASQYESYMLDMKNTMKALDQQRELYPQLLKNRIVYDAHLRPPTSELAIPRPPSFGVSGNGDHIVDADPFCLFAAAKQSSIVPGEFDGSERSETKQSTPAPPQGTADYVKANSDINLCGRRLSSKFCWWYPIYPVYGCDKDEFLLEPYYKPLAGDDNTLVFESRFESGNLRRAVQIYVDEYDLVISPDANTDTHTQWYYFCVSNTRKGMPYKFNFVNLTKTDSLYNHGMQPLMFSVKRYLKTGVGWTRSGSNVCYYCNNIRKQSSNGSDGGNSGSGSGGGSSSTRRRKKKRKKGGGTYYTLTATFELEYDLDTVFFAYCYPYTFTDLQNVIRTLTKPGSERANVCSSRVLTQTLAGNECYVLTISDHVRQSSLKNKQAIIISARVHPGESNASWMMHGLLDFLTGDSLQAHILREHFIFYIVPMLNPDGVICGNYRCSLSGNDLNRCWLAPSRTAQPTIFHTKALIQRVAASRDVVLCLDMHGHSRKFNIFIYGCDTALGLSTPHFKSRAPQVPFVDIGNLCAKQCMCMASHPAAKWYSEQWWQASGAKCINQRMRGLQSNSREGLLYNGVTHVNECIFPRMMNADGNSIFSYSDCNFSVTKSKESTFRVVVWRELGLANAFTMEASFAGASLGPYSGFQFQMVDFALLGMQCGLTLLSYAVPSMRVHAFLGLSDFDAGNQAFVDSDDGGPAPASDVAVTNDNSGNTAKSRRSEGSGELSNSSDSGSATHKRSSSVPASKARKQRKRPPSQRSLDNAAGRSVPSAVVRRRVKSYSAKKPKRSAADEQQSRNEVRGYVVGSKYQTIANALVSNTQAILNRAADAGKTPEPSEPPKAVVELPRPHSSTSLNSMRTSSARAATHSDPEVLYIADQYNDNDYADDEDGHSEGDYSYVSDMDQSDSLSRGQRTAISVNVHHTSFQAPAAYYGSGSSEPEVAAEDFIAHPGPVRGAEYVGEVTVRNGRAAQEFEGTRNGRGGSAETKQPLINRKEAGALSEMKKASKLVGKAVRKKKAGAKRSTRVASKSATKSQRSTSRAKKTRSKTRTRARKSEKSGLYKTFAQPPSYEQYSRFAGPHADFQALRGGAFLSSEGLQVLRVLEGNYSTVDRPRKSKVSKQRARPKKRKGKGRK